MAHVSRTRQRWYLVGILVAVGLLYCWGAGSSGWEFGYYTAAVQAGTKSLHAAFFGSLDGIGVIAIDKTPAALWVMELSARIFGLSPWSMILPEALEGVGTIWLMYLCALRCAGQRWALVAAATAGLTPVATAVFRYNNPDALLVLLVTGAAYAMLRACESARGRWVVLSGALVGLAFLAKMTEALLVVPGMAASYLIYGEISVGRRLKYLGYFVAAFVVMGGWWPVAVSLVPPGQRPYIGSTRDNSVWSLLLGYNGLDRITGHPVVHGGAGRSFMSAIARLFGSQMGTQISWFLPMAAMVAVAAWVFGGQSPDTRRVRRGLLLWGAWLVVAGGVFSLGGGAINPYYTVLLVPAMGSLVGIGYSALWARRGDRIVRWVFAGSILATGAWAFHLLDQYPAFAPWLRDGVVLLSVVAVAGVVGRGWCGRWAVRGFLGGAAALVVLAGPAVYCLGAVVNPSPSVDPYASPPQWRGRPDHSPVGGDTVEMSRPGRAIVAILSANERRYAWVAATVGAVPAAGYQIATGMPVMALGGWLGTDPAPSLRMFVAWTKEGKVHYFIPSGSYGGIRLGRSLEASAASKITKWVGLHFRPETVGGIELYDLSKPQANCAREPRKIAIVP